MPIQQKERPQLGQSRAKYVNIVRGELSYLDSNGDPILWCHSRGDRRFSPLVAMLGCEQTIEIVYQQAKRDKEGKPIAISPGHDTNAAFLKVGNELLPFHEWKHEYWYMLWQCYFWEHPELLEHARQFVGFRDPFDTRGGEIYYRDDPAIHTYGGPEQFVCQSRAIVWSVIGRPVHTQMQTAIQVYQRRFGK